MAKKWVDGLQRYQNVEDLLNDVDEHINNKERDLRKEIKQQSKNPRANVDEIL